MQQHQLRSNLTASVPQSQDEVHQTVLANCVGAMSPETHKTVYYTCKLQEVSSCSCTMRYDIQL